MPTLSTADTLTAAAERMQNTTLPSDITITLARLLRSAAEEFEMCERINSRDPYNDGKTGVLPHHLATSALAVACALLGEVTE